jgi:hypothetical protein
MEVTGSQNKATTMSTMPSGLVISEKRNVSPIPPKMKGGTHTKSESMKKAATRLPYEA